MKKLSKKSKRALGYYIAGNPVCHRSFGRNNFLFMFRSFRRRLFGVFLPQYF